MHDKDLAKPATPRPAEESGNGVLPGGPSWAVRNARRLELIEREVAKGLTQAEAAELRLLQEECDRWLDALGSLPFDALERVKDCARREGLLAPSYPKE